MSDDTELANRIARDLTALLRLPDPVAIDVQPDRIVIDLNDSDDTIEIRRLPAVLTRTGD